MPGLGEREIRCAGEAHEATDSTTLAPYVCALCVHYELLVGSCEKGLTIRSKCRVRAFAFPKTE